MGPKVLYFGLAALGLCLLCAGVDSWLFAGQFIHSAVGAHMNTEAEFIGAALALYFAAGNFRDVDQFISAGTALVALFLIGSALCVLFDIALVPAWFASLKPKADHMLIAGIVVAIFGVIR